MPGDDVAKRLVVAVNDLDGEDESASFEELMKIVVKSGQAKTSDVMEMGKKKKSKNALNGPRVISKTTIKTLWAIANRCTSIEQLESNNTTDRDMAIVRGKFHCHLLLYLLSKTPKNVIFNIINIFWTSFTLYLHTIFIKNTFFCVYSF